MFYLQQRVICPSAGKIGNDPSDYIGNQMHIPLRKALSVLGKSSPFSVSTVTERREDDLDQYKERLYVEQQIEKEFRERASTLSSGEIIFLCGSSGDGKSEILTRAFDTFKDKCDFHLDATHSFSAHETAIEALDRLFDRFVSAARPLILGINIGMLANYAKEGAERHSQIKERISSFLHGTLDKIGGFHFLDFESFSKFNFSDDGEFSEFTEKLLHNLSERSAKNPFYLSARGSESDVSEIKLVSNFDLLGLPGVRKVIITQLFKARLLKDQFITTRAILDLLHHLITSDGYLFDNLYMSGANELIERTAEFDPALLRTKKLDDFILRYELGLPDAELDIFVAKLSSLNIYFNRTAPSPGDAVSLIRLFSLLRDEDIANNYHKQFLSEFVDITLIEYSKIWNLHSNYDGESSDKIAIRKYYTGMFTAGVLRYANRHATEMLGANNEIFLGYYGSSKLAAKVDIRFDFDKFSALNRRKSIHFYATLKVFDTPLNEFAVTMSLFELLTKLNLGYRPNKYDKNAVVLLDEIVEKIKAIAKKQGQLKIYTADNSYATEMDDGMIIFNRGA